MKVRKPKFKEGDKVVITWLDTVGESSGWMIGDAEDAIEQQLVSSLCQAIGFFHSYSHKFIHITQLWRPTDGAFSRLLSVPLSCIVNIKKVGRG